MWRGESPTGDSCGPLPAGSGRSPTLLSPSAGGEEAEKGVGLRMWWSAAVGRRRVCGGCAVAVRGSRWRGRWLPFGFFFSKEKGPVREMEEEDGKFEGCRLREEMNVWGPIDWERGRNQIRPAGSEKLKTTTGGGCVQRRKNSSDGWRRPG